MFSTRRRKPPKTQIPTPHTPLPNPLLNPVPDTRQNSFKIQKSPKFAENLRKFEMLEHQADKSMNNKISKKISSENRNQQLSSTDQPSLTKHSDTMLQKQENQSSHFLTKIENLQSTKPPEPPYHPSTTTSAWPAANENWKTKETRLLSFMSQPIRLIRKIV